MKYEKPQWIKFKNKLFPKYYPETWTVYNSENNGIMFTNFELAVIYEKLKLLEEKLENKK